MCHHHSSTCRPFLCVTTTPLYVSPPLLYVCHHHSSICVTTTPLSVSPPLLYMCHHHSSICVTTTPLCVSLPLLYVSTVPLCHHHPPMCQTYPLCVLSLIDYNAIIIDSYTKVQGSRSLDSGLPSYY